MKRNFKQAGFTLVTAIFLLVVVAGLIVYMTNISVVQHTTAAYGLQGARGLQAARSGLEWGISRAIVSNSCAASTSFTDPALAGFSVQVQCAQTSHTEGTAPAGTINTYRLVAIATSGSYGTLDYVQRRLQATVSQDPP